MQNLLYKCSMLENEERRYWWIEVQNNNIKRKLIKELDDDKRKLSAEGNIEEVELSAAEWRRLILLIMHCSLEGVIFDIKSVRSRLMRDGVRSKGNTFFF
jgi:hypothetical protein